ncbi:activating transcription factor 7-interacting protein 2-like isoform X2 [Polyodon spathula]|nr:activating transcription factor 7-interacting protein 2-like isoform X2 [Polyodon spathula]
MVKQEAFALFKQFDTKFEELTERIKKVECSPKHEMLVTKLQAQIFKIKRRLQEALISENRVARPMKPKISSVVILDEVCSGDGEKMIDLTADDNDDQLGGLQPAAVNESSVSVAHVSLTLCLPAKDPMSPTSTLPPLPETAVPLDLPAVAASFNMPQKPELKVTNIENPKGVGILWDLSQVDTSVASIQSYCLHVLYENANVRKLRWRSIGVIKAIQLPMCCRLTKVSPGRYHFAVVGKDIYGRFGPYSDIQSTTVNAVDV